MVVRFISENKLNGKIGYVKNIDLGIRKYPDDGHYVYIRKDKGKRCDVNVITSLEDKYGNINNKRIRKVRKGYLYPLPYKDTNFDRWSAIDLTSINHIDRKNIYRTNKKIKKRHKWFVGFFSKK